jgi:hypothetical protein
MEFFKNQLLLLLMIKSYDVSFYTLLLLISTFYTKDFILSFFPNFVPDQKELKDSKELKVESVNLKNDSELKSSISIEIFLHKQNDTLAHSLLDYVTNKPNIQSISYSKNKFMLFKWISS